jgi:drug/metabolite transporter (DMT)-like permease
MPLLLLVSLIWAFSFGLIKGELTGIPSAAVAFIRMAIAMAVFVPFLRLRNLRAMDSVRLILTGAVQYGLMYVAYIQAFIYLKAYEVALFTVFTPIYVTLINDLFERKTGLTALVAGMLAVAGGLVIEYRQLSSPELWRGFLLMQSANLCFAFGQIFYRRTMSRLPKNCTDLNVFSLLYLGAVLVTALASGNIDWSTLVITPKQAGILLYLGAIASGLGFLLWNIGVRKVGTGTLAVFNNLKIPLGVLASILLFDEKTSWPHLLSGGILMALALTVNNGIFNQHLALRPK